MTSNIDFGKDVQVQVSNRLFKEDTDTIVMQNIQN